MASVNHMPSLIRSGSSALEFLNPVAHINLPVRIFSDVMSLRCGKR